MRLRPVDSAVDEVSRYDSHYVGDYEADLIERGVRVVYLATEENEGVGGPLETMGPPDDPSFEHYVWSDIYGVMLNDLHLPPLPPNDAVRVRCPTCHGEGKVLRWEVEK